MNKNRFGPGAYSAALLIAIYALFGFAANALADDKQATLYHVQESTFGCVDPAATRELTDSSNPGRSNSKWIKTTIANGRCVSITPRSPWKLVTQDNGVALMEYAGNVGPPGSYYIATAELVDPLGNHPDTTPPAPAAAAPSPAPDGTTAAAPAGTGTETALAPSFPEGSNTAMPAPPHTGWSTWDVLLLLIAISIAGVVGYVVGRNTRD